MSDSLAVSSSSDFLCDHCGSVVLLHPLTDAARDWVEEYIGQGNGFQPYWPTVVIEPRYVSEILEGINNDGLAVSR